MEEKLKIAMKIVGGVALVLFLSLFLVYFSLYTRLKATSEANQPTTDTTYLYVTDTVTNWHEHTTTLHHYDTTTLSVIDTCYETDSIQVQVPIYTYVYDTLTPDSVMLHAKLQGYNVMFDELRLQYVKQQNTTIVKPVKIEQKHWGVGVSAGMGAGYGLLNKKVDVFPYVGISLNYNIFSW